jgi:hypothetical protein
MTCDRPIGPGVTGNGDELSGLGDRGDGDRAVSLQENRGVFG